MCVAFHDHLLQLLTGKRLYDLITQFKDVFGLFCVLTFQRGGPLLASEHHVSLVLHLYIADMQLLPEARGRLEHTLVCKPLVIGLGSILNPGQLPGFMVREGL